MAKRKRPKRSRIRRYKIHVEDGQPVDVPDVPEIDPANLPFMGELMTCFFCRRQQKSDPLIESGWLAVVVDGHRYYICPAELTPKK